MKKNLSKLMNDSNTSHTYTDDTEIDLNRKYSSIDEVIANFTESDILDRETTLSTNNSLKLVDSETIINKLSISDLRFKYRYNIHKLVKIVMDNIKQNIFTVSNSLKIKELGLKDSFDSNIMASLKY